jgi:hypothetical protein
MASATQAGGWVARHFSRFTTDEVWERLRPTGLRTPEHRAMGSVMRGLAKAGLCVRTNEVQESSRAGCHHRPLRVWRSLVYNGAY